MQSGVHRNLPSSEAPEFRRELLLQAKSEDVGLDITETDNGDGTVTVAWRVLRSDSKPAVAPSVNPDIPDRPPVPALDSPDPAPAGPPDRFVNARRTAPLTVVYIDAQGREFIRQGGSRSWRNYNQGNIRKGSFADMSGAIGDDGAFAIFPDEKTGFAAVVGLLRSASYKALSLRDAIFRYAPPSENDSERYVAFVTKEADIAPDAVLGDLPSPKTRALAAAIQKLEGWVPGTERSNGPASGADVILAAVSGGVSAAAGAAHEWMDIAEREAALPEHERSAWRDPDENPRILEYFRVAAAWFEPGDGDETDWCAAFVNYCLVMSGQVGTDHPGARSFYWNKKNQFVRLDQPRRGAIAVRRYPSFADPKWATGQGHVGFVTSFTSTHVTLLGGNQSNTVMLQKFPVETQNAAGELTSKFVAFMMPVMT